MLRKGLLAAVLMTFCGLIPQSSISSSPSSTGFSEGKPKTLLKATADVAPKAVLIGPKEKAAGRSVILKTTGSVGDDPVFSCFPLNEEWYPVRFQDGSLGLIFETDTDGYYAFAFAVNKGGKTAVATHVVKIGQPVPPTPPDALDAALGNAYKMDLAAGVGTSDQKKMLSACYKQAISSLFPTFKTNADCQSGMKALNDSIVGVGKLPSVRQAIAVDVRDKIGGKASDTFDAMRSTVEWNRIATALDKLTP